MNNGKISASKLLAGLVPADFIREEVQVELVTTDSREVRPGCIFVAFPGEKFDGHDFAAKALENGAVYVVVNHPVEGVPAEKAILCPDSYHAMMVMGANYRSQYHPKMVGVTGSVGKTTTKQMTYAALAGFGETIKTEGNQNNELGMPRTLMRLESSTEYAVIEMGMSHAGEIDVWPGPHARMWASLPASVCPTSAIWVVRRTSARQSWRSATACRRVHRWC